MLALVGAALFTQAAAQAPGRPAATSASVVPTAPAASTAAVPDTLAQRLAPCMACHGAQGRASRQGYLPRIAGKPAGYLYHQLLNFRDGRRANPTMAELLAHQRDSYLAEMASHFASIELPYAAPTADALPPALQARGEALVRQGDPARGVPACAACHGPALTGTLPAVPGLLGLPRDYLIGQLGAWRTGSRRAHAPDCMADISRRLADADVAAVAAWLAQQPVPSPATARAAPPTPPPMDCGAQRPSAGTP